MDLPNILKKKSTLNASFVRSSRTPPYYPIQYPRVKVANIQKKLKRELISRSVDRFVVRVLYIDHVFISSV